MTHRLASQATALSLALVVTLGMLSSMELLAGRATGGGEDTIVSTSVPVQTIVVVGRRALRS